MVIIFEFDNLMALSGTFCVMAIERSVASVEVRTETLEVSVSPIVINV